MITTRYVIFQLASRFTCHNSSLNRRLLGDPRRLFCDDFLLLRDNGLVFGVPLLQLTNTLLIGRQLIGKRWTSVFHTL